MDESTLLDAARRGERHAMRWFVEEHQQLVYRVALGLTRNWADAEDVVQDVFIRALAALPRFRGDAKVSSWLYRIAVNTSRTRLSRGPARTEEGLEGALELVEARPAANPHRRAEAAAIRQHIDEGLRRLSRAEREVFTLRFYSELSIREIAAAVDRAEGTVKSLLFRGLKKMRKELAPHLRPQLAEVET